MKVIPVALLGASLLYSGCVGPFGKPIPSSHGALKPEGDYVTPNENKSLANQQLFINAAAKAQAATGVSQRAAKANDDAIKARQEALDKGPSAQKAKEEAKSAHDEALKEAADIAARGDGARKTAAAAVGEGKRKLANAQSEYNEAGRSAAEVKDQGVKDGKAAAASVRAKKEALEGAVSAHDKALKAEAKIEEANVEARKAAAAEVKAKKEALDEAKLAYDEALKEEANIKAADVEARGIADAGVETKGRVLNDLQFDYDKVLKEEAKVKEADVEAREIVAASVRAKVEALGEATLVYNKIFENVKSAENGASLAASQEAKAIKDKKAALKEYFMAGTALSSELTAKWFDALQNEQTKTRYQKGYTNIIGATAIAVLGITGAEAEQLALLGIALAGMNAQFDNYTSSYLLTPTLDLVHDKVVTGRADYKAIVVAELESRSDLTYSEVQDALQRYHAIGSSVNIQAILRKSVEIAKFEPPAEAFPKDASYRTRKLKELRDHLMADGQSFDPVAAQVLYVISKAPPGDKSPYKEMAADGAYVEYSKQLAKLKSSSDPTEKERYKKVIELLEVLEPLVNGAQALENARKVERAPAGVGTLAITPPQPARIPEDKPESTGGTFQDALARTPRITQ